VVVDLAGALASSTGDDQVDTITVNGSAGNDMRSETRDPGPHGVAA